MQLAAGHDASPSTSDAELAGDRAGGRRMVAGDHHRRDARGLARRHRRLRLGARRIEQSDQTEQCEVALDLVRCLAFLGNSSHGAVPRRARAGLRPPWLRRSPTRGARFAGRSASLPHLGFAAIQHRFRRALGVSDDMRSVAFAMDRGRSFAIRIERKLQEARRCASSVSGSSRPRQPIATAQPR